MTAIVPAEPFVSACAEATQLKVARSDFIDAFNRADASLRDLLASLNRAPGQNLSQNVRTLEACNPAPNYPRQTKARVDKLMKELTQLALIRCDLVHGVMSVLSIDGAGHALFENVQHRSALGRSGLMLRVSEIDGATRRLEAISRSLRDRSSANAADPSPGETATS